MKSWENGVRAPFFWDTDRVPHVLLSGLTGGGKTVLAQIIVNQILSEHKLLYICDFKQEEIGMVLFRIMLNIRIVTDYLMISIILLLKQLKTGISQRSIWYLMNLVPIC